MTLPAPSPRPGTRRVSATFTHSAAPDDLVPGGASFLEVLARRFPYLTAAQWTQRIGEGRVTLNGATVAPGTPVRRGDLITSHVTDYEEPAVPIDFHEVAARGDLALVHKPSGLPVHKTGRVFVNVLANLYRATKNDDGWTPLNRLDAETSGIVAFARGRDALWRFSPAHPACRWRKAYLAVVDGMMVSPCVHDGALAEWREHPIRSRMRVAPEAAGGKSARTEFSPLATRDGRTLVLARPITGRKHQIRAHLADLGFPIVGDKVYHHEGRYYLKRFQGELTSADYEALGAPYQLLHAVSLSIENTGDVGVKEAARGASTTGGVTGISGFDFDLPEGFRRYFPEATEEWLREGMRKSLPDFEYPVSSGSLHPLAKKASLP